MVESESSRHGRWVLLRHYRAGARDIYAVDLADGTERVAVGNPADDYSPALSPDGKWLAHVLEESGRPEVWVVPFPDAGGSRWQVTTTGGSEPAWSRDGRELYFVAPGSELRAVAVRPGPAFSFGPARPCSRWPATRGTRPTGPTRRSREGAS